MLVEDIDFVNYIVERSQKLQLKCDYLESFSVENLSGNMNRVRRVNLTFSNGRQSSLVIKHLPENGKLERFPTLNFPENRLSFEVKFNEICRQKNLSSRMRLPKLLDYNQTFDTLIFENLANGIPLTKAAPVQQGKDATIQIVASFLARLHTATYTLEPFDNPSAKLNRPFVLNLPLEQPELVQELWKKHTLNNETSSLEVLLQIQDWFLNVYSTRLIPVLRQMDETFKLTQVNALSHGDFHGDSLLLLPDQSIGLIDGELCDFGSPAFDIGIFLAHVIGYSRCHPGIPLSINKAQIVLFWQIYQSELKKMPKDNITETNIQNLHIESLRYIGAEIIRRILGPARFPFIDSIPEIPTLLKFAAELVYKPENFHLLK